jgi:hypothetical protein
MTDLKILPVLIVASVGFTAKGSVPKVTFDVITEGGDEESVSVTVAEAFPVPGSCNAVKVTSVPLTTTDSTEGKLLTAL